MIALAGITVFATLTVFTRGVAQVVSFVCLLVCVAVDEVRGRTRRSHDEP